MAVALVACDMTERAVAVDDTDRVERSLRRDGGGGGRLRNG
jgi:hypothetical protein